MKLINDDLIKRFLEQGNTSDKKPEDIKIICKLFNPAGVGTWYMTEYYPEIQTFFGYANLGDPENAELGYISLVELQSYTSQFGTVIERDLHFGEHTLKEVIDSKGTL